MIILNENIVRAQLSNEICPTCESKVKGRRVPNSTNKNAGGWNKDFAWQVFSDTRPVTYYHLICYRPETHDGKTELEYADFRGADLRGQNLRDLKFRGIII